jgi:D-alanyl-D-alanine carboxypeptidase
LVTAVRNAGYGQLQINTAFRDYNLQATWWGNYVRNGGSKTYPTTLPPGHSEHQLGTTLDINVYAKPGLNAWMAANAWKYGFVKSYPSGKNASHCIASEDWHYRYYGRTTASLITKSKLTTREWLWYARH